jgi:hypothetical protein
MSTRGDLFITTNLDNRKETNRFFISSDAYLDDGMKTRIIKALKFSEEKNISFTNALISLYPEYIHIQNSDVDGGYTYELDLIENIIKFGYKYNSSEKWCIKETIADFISSSKTEKDYQEEYLNYKDNSW